MSKLKSHDTNYWKSGLFEEGVVTAIKQVDDFILTMSATDNSCKGIVDYYN